MNYKQAYYKYYGLDECDVIYCFICSAIATQLHHIKYKSQGGSDHPDNLARMCYDCHDSHHCRNKPTTEEIKKAMLLNQPPF
jgi:5-methylcytosine-specific restriction endonuclease McrA